MSTAQSQDPTIQQIVPPVDPPVQQPAQSEENLDSLAQPFQQVMQTYDPLNPQGAVSSPQKETSSASPSEVSSPHAEIGASLTSLEQEISSESQLSPEVAGYIEELRSDLQTPSQVVVIDDDGQVTLEPPKFEEVIVLPLTQEKVEKGLQKSPKLSIRWLAEWCVRMMKKYSGLVVYKE